MINPEQNQQDKLARAERLKRIRLMAGLSRREICAEGSGLHPDTYKGWETARFGGLTERGAEKVIARIFENSVVASVEWLLYGIGVQPFENLSDINICKTMLSDQDRQIAKELLVFKEQKNTVDLMLQDETMAPLYSKDDIVAGIKVMAVENAIGLDCIIQTESGEIVFRKLHAGRQEGVYTLLAHQSEAPILADVKILMAAPVIWWRRKSI